MTLKRKIWLLIAVLAFFIVIAMSGAYYHLFSQYIEQQSLAHVSLAIDIILDDLQVRSQDLLHKTEALAQQSYSSSLYLTRLYQEQYQQQEEWTIREVRKIMTYLSAIANETMRFGELIGAAEILLYDHNNRLTAVYRNTVENTLMGMYLPQVAQEHVLLFEPEDDWFMSIKNLGEIPKAPLPDDLSIQYQAEMPSASQMSLNTLNRFLIIRIETPILQKDIFHGICVVKLHLTQRDVERYAALSKTRINIFAGTSWSVGTLPEHRNLPAESLAHPQQFDLHTGEQNSPEPLFLETTLADEVYYQGVVVLGDQDRITGGFSIFVPRAEGEEARKKFLIIVGSLVLVFGIITAAGAAFLSTLIVNPIISLTTLLKQLTQGELSDLGHTPQKADRISQAPTRNELTLLFRSFDKMLTYLREMAAIAEHISRGEIEQKITPRSDRDALGQTFSQMTSYLNTIASVAIAVSEGDLRQNIVPQTDQDILGQAFHRLQSLRQTMGSIMQEADQLSMLSDDLYQISSQMATGAQQSSHKVREISFSSEAVSENVHEVAVSTKQMSENIREISTRTDDVAEIVNAAVKTAQATGSTIADLETRSREIGKIIKVITSITEQTNLLALNATIEAARAGESGKGFAVVASEVKQLAREITVSAKDITHKIEAIQASSQQATQAISDMADYIQKIQVFMEIILNAISEQSATTDVITLNLSEAASGTEMVSKAIAEVTDVVQHSSELAQKVRQSAETQAAVAEQLRQQIKTFQI